MSNEDSEQNYEESIKNLQNIINKVKETNLEEDSSSNIIHTDNSVSNEKIEKKIIKRKISKPSPNKQNLDNLESEDIINSTSVIDEEDAEKLSFDKLEIKEEENYFSLDKDSSKSFEDNINNKSSAKSKNITTDHLEKPSDEDLDNDSDEGLYCLAWMYYYGHGVAEDEDKCYELMRQAADMGNENAIEWLNENN